MKRRRRPKTIPGLFGQPVRVDSLPTMERPADPPPVDTSHPADRRISKQYDPKATEPLPFEESCDDPNKNGA
jgi:hypothetical protein